MTEWKRKEEQEKGGATGWEDPEPGKTWVLP